MGSDLLGWVDTETTGLEDDDVILELGIIITDMWGNEIASRDWLVGNATDHFISAVKRGKAHEIVGPMHRNSGLWAEWQGALAYDSGRIQPFFVESQAVLFLEEHGIEKFTVPMCGNSIHSDRKWMHRDLPLLEEYFHYRNIDVSTVKELCRRFNKPVYDKLGEHAPKSENHRVLDDLRDTLKEYKFYVDNFLWVADEVF